MRNALPFALTGMLVAGFATANFCAQDAVPAATLLLPYIEVAMTAEGVPDFEGQTTISQITNVGEESIVIHVTVWDVAGIPRFCFDEVLSGRDVLRINWRDLVSGRGDLFDTSTSDFTVTPPLTRDPFEWGPDGRLQTGGLTTPGNRSAITSAQCPGPPPYGDRSDLAPTIRMLLRGSQIARSHLGCAPPDLRRDLRHFGSDLDDSKLFFYATVDVVASCTALDPRDASYWSGVARDANVLTGQVIYLSARDNTSEMMPAVHIEAAAAAGGGGPSVFGFFEEKTGGIETNREPLATAFMVPYVHDPSGSITSSLIVWKNFTELDTPDDPSSATWGTVADCGSYLYYAWDMDERSLAVSSGGTDAEPFREVNQLPFATQKVPLNTSYFDLPAADGWFLLVLPPSYGGGYVDPTPEQGEWLTRLHMGWVAWQVNYGTYSAGSEAVTMANALCFPSQTLPGLGVNDGSSPIR